MSTDSKLPKVPEFGTTARGTPRKRPARDGEGRAVAGKVAGLLTPRLLQQIARLAKGGLTDFEIRRSLGIDDSTWSRFHGKPVFQAALRGVNDDIATERVERALLHRAVGYSHPAVKVLQDKGVPVIVPFTEHYPPDVEAAKTWLHNRAGHRWKPKQEGNQGVTVIINSQMVLDALAGREPAALPQPDAREPVTIEHKP